MTTDPTDQAARNTRPRDPRDLGMLRRSTTDKHIAGVAGGLARHFDIDPIIIRVALVVLCFFGGAGLILYAAIWLLVPQDDEDEAMVRLDGRSRSFLLYVVGAVAIVAILGDTVGDFHLPWGLLVVGLIVVLVLGNRERVRWRSREGVAERGYAGPYDSTRSVYDTPVGTASGTTSGTAPDPATGTSYAPGTGAAYSAKVTADVEQRVQQRVDASLARYHTRRRGPILFWFTVALILVTQGALGIVDLAGANVADAAYPAVALGVIGVMLVLGAFWGRAGGLILLGLLTALVLSAATAADQWGLDHHGRTVTYAPITSAAVLDSYSISTGELTVDLSQVTDPQALAGRTIEIDSHVGTIDVIVPTELNVDAHGRVHGPGQVDIFDDGSGGINTSLSGSARPSSSLPDLAPLTIEAELNVGRITVESR